MFFLILGQYVHVDCTDPSARHLLSANFGAAAVADLGRQPNLHYLIQRIGRPERFLLRRESQAPQTAEGLGELLFMLEKDVVVEFQTRRADLFFLHAAAVAWEGRAVLLAADSGHGKSTTTWGLLHHGFSYLSDELAPVDLSRLEVLAYPHALCLKQAPAAPYSLPAAAVRLDGRIHVPVSAMPGSASGEARPIGAVILVRHDPLLLTPTLHAIGAAEAGARLYLTALNALAHANHGLDAVVRIVRHVPCFALATADLAMTCALVRSAAGKMLAAELGMGSAPAE